MNEPLHNLPESAKAKLQKASQPDWPDWMDPMLATLTHDKSKLSESGWIYERKLDGERCLVFRDGENVRLLSRNQQEINVQYPELAEAFEKLEVQQFIVDGEIVAFDDNDVSSFERLQGRINLSSEEEARRSDVKVYLYLFDMLYLYNYVTTDLPLRQRKKLLKDAFSYSDPIRFVPHQKEGEQFFAEACESGWEGIIGKKADGTYVHGRSRNWLKFKCVNQQELVIGGYSEPHGERIGFGALLLGYYEGDKFRYAGKVGTGFDDDTLEDLQQRLSSLERKTPPFDDDDLPDTEVHWVTPQLAAEIGFEEWTKHNKLRQPRYLGLRNDKAAEYVAKEG